MSDISIKQALEGFVIEDMNDRIQMITDPIDVLMNFNVEEKDDDTLIREESSDDSQFEETDNYGELPSSGKAFYADRQYRKQVLTIPRFVEKQFVITEENFLKYGIDYGMIDVVADDSAEVALGMYNNMSREITKLVSDAIQEERDKIHTVLDELGSSSDAFVLPYNEQIIADSRSNGIWNFDNKGTAALSETELGVGNNSFGNHLDIKGKETGKHTGRMLLVASDTTTAEKLFMPDIVKDITLRSIADGGGYAVPKMVGKYKPASSAELNDWILISDYVFRNKTFRRIVSSQYKSVSVSGVTLTGWKVDMYENKDKHCIVISIKGRSKFAIESPVGWYKGIVAN